MNDELQGCQTLLSKQVYTRRSEGIFKLIIIPGHNLITPVVWVVSKKPIVPPVEGIKNPSLPSCFIGTPELFFPFISPRKCVHHNIFFFWKRRQQYVLCIYAENSPFCCLTNLCFTYVRNTEKKKKIFSTIYSTADFFSVFCLSFPFISFSLLIPFIFCLLRSPQDICVRIYFYFIIFSIKVEKNMWEKNPSIDTNTHTIILTMEI